MAQSSSRKTTSHGPNDNNNTRQTNITNFFSTNTNAYTNTNNDNKRKVSSSSRTSYHRPIVLEDDDSDDDDDSVGYWVPPPPARVQSYNIHSTSSSTSNSSHSFQLVISKGSVVGFCHPDDAKAHTANQQSIIRRHPATGIVNAANEGCLYGGGVDGAITQAGGEALYQDRLALPILRRRRSSTPVRCPTGSAKITGAPDRIYGILRVSHVVHAVGPDYRFFPPPSRTDEADRLLRSAYLQSLERARENKLQVLGFALLSAGVFRDYVSLEHVLRIAVEAICHFAHAAGGGGGCYDELKEVHLCGYTDEEIQTLLDVSEQIGLQPNHIKPFEGASDDDSSR